MADDCEHLFINTNYDARGNVKATCSTCHADVTKPHHVEMAKLYKRGASH